MSTPILSFFFDIDGTLLPFGMDIPESAKRAIERLKRDGHRIFLSSGRSVAEVDSRVISLGFDGGVFSSGANVIYRGKTIFKKTISKRESEAILDYSDKNHLYLIAQTDEGTYLTKESGEFFNKMILKYVGRLLDIPNFKIVEKLDAEKEYSKYLFLTENGDVERVRKELEEEFAIVDNTVGLPPSMMAEIVMKDITKATGIDEISKYFGDDSKIVSFGDGANDIEMIEASDLGIAMGNSSEDLKKRADYITDDILCDGIKKGIDYALEYFSSRDCREDCR